MTLKEQIIAMKNELAGLKGSVVRAKTTQTNRLSIAAVSRTSSLTWAMK